jgi:hypothetical protein
VGTPGTGSEPPGEAGAPGEEPEPKM